MKMWENSKSTHSRKYILLNRYMNENCRIDAQSTDLHVPEEQCAKSFPRSNVGSCDNSDDNAGQTEEKCNIKIHDTISTNSSASILDAANKCEVVCPGTKNEFDDQNISEMITRSTRSTSSWQQPSSQTRRNYRKRHISCSMGCDKIKCKVCLAPASIYVQYGATACFACRAFFRRSVFRSLYTSYTCYCIHACDNIRMCVMSPDKRNNCKKCRFERCLHIGMQTRLVLTEEQLDTRFNKPREEKKMTL